MSDSRDRVSIELIDAGDHKDRVVLVLSKVKGLTMPPQQIVRNTPCTVATNVPREIAEKLQDFLEKAGAMVMLEGGEAELFSPAGLPLTAEEGLPAPDEQGLPLIDQEEQKLSEDLMEPVTEEFLSASEEPIAPDIPVPPAFPEREEARGPVAEQKPGKLQQLLAALPRLGRKQGHAETEAATAPPERKLSLAFLSNFWSKFRTTTATVPGEETPAEVHKSVAMPMKKIPDLMSNRLFLFVTGCLLGVTVTGVWGSISIQSLRQDTSQQVEQLSQKMETLKQKNVTLEGQITTLITQMEKARQSTSMTSETAEKELLQSFQKVLAVHAQSLEKGYDAQKQANCSQQLLLDGKSTYTYAQVVKKFDSADTKHDILKSNSLLTPYRAEFKIGFQEEIRTGNTEEACNAATLQQLETPEHHEFGGYYGYWTIEYTYQDGKWVVNPTVTEKNRALYESAFQRGSPDYAKFRIDPKLFPEFETQPAQ